MHKYEAIYKEHGFTYCPISEADFTLTKSNNFKPFKKFKIEDRYSVNYQNKITEFVLPTIKSK